MCIQGEDVDVSDEFLLVLHCRSTEGPAARLARGESTSLISPLLRMALTDAILSKVVLTGAS